MRDEGGKCGTCGSYLKSILKFLVSHIGLVSLVVGYTIIGALTFEKLEAGHEIEVKMNMSSVRDRVTDQLWNITNNMRMLERYNWSAEARGTLKKFEKSLIKAIKTDGWDGNETNKAIQWTFSGALFYSIILITTIGYGHIAPKTPWGKVVTIFYAIPGVPLMMLCLANIGDGMAHSFRFLYWKVCCYACTKRPKRKRRTKSTSRISRSSHHSSGGSHAPHPRSSSFRRSARTSQRSADSQYSDPAFYTNPEYSSGGRDAPHPRSSSSRRSARTSQRSADSQYSDPAFYTNPEYKLHEQGDGDLGDGGAPHGGRVGPPAKSDLNTPRSSGKGGTRSSDRSNNRSSQNSKQSQEDAPSVAVLYNKYALDQEGAPDNEEEGRGAQRSPHRSLDRSREEGGRGRGRDTDERRAVRSHSVTGTPPMGRGRQYPQHMTPPHDPRMMSSRLDPPQYLDDEDSDEYEDGPDNDMGDPGDKPVPIWLGVMLVVVYILGGAVMFARNEGWDFLDAVYFCFITLTTIGFGDFVPAQEKKENAKLSIALCSLYLLFGIALLAMSFNLVQEEVISNVKSVAKRLGIIKEEEDQLQD